MFTGRPSGLRLRAILARISQVTDSAWPVEASFLGLVNNSLNRNELLQSTEDHELFAFINSKMCSGIFDGIPTTAHSPIMTLSQI